MRNKINIVIAMGFEISKCNFSNVLNMECGSEAKIHYVRTVLGHVNDISFQGQDKTVLTKSCIRIPFNLANFKTQDNRPSSFHKDNVS